MMNDNMKCFFDSIMVKCFFWSVMAWLLSSCAPLSPIPSFKTHQLNSWRLNGRIAISTQQDSWTANVYWQQQGPAYQLRLNTPLGQGALLLEGNDSGVMMQTANNQVFRARDPDALVSKVLKLHLPVTGLHFWIRGLPMPKPAPQWYQLNDRGQLHRLRQNGWEIEYGHYVNFQGIELPKKIFLENHQFKVKIIISNWDSLVLGIEKKNLRKFPFTSVKSSPFG
jgi:outer membrane lipoprotein LolB